MKSRLRMQELEQRRQYEEMEKEKERAQRFVYVIYYFFLCYRQCLIV